MREDLTAELLRVISQVRRRWRMKVALRGVVILAALTLALFLISARALEAARFTPQAIFAFRLGLLGAVVGLATFLLARPLFRRVKDDQVAMYLEEHEPSLQASIISALEASRDTSTPHSRALVNRLVEEAIEKARRIEYGKRVEQQPVRKYAATIAAVVAAAVALLVFGPAYLRHAGAALLMFSRDVEAAVPYRIEVKPGNATVAKGADLSVSAQLGGFESSDATLMVRKQTPDAQYERFPMIRGESGGYDGMLFDLAQPMEYFVEAAGVRSPTYTLKVVELPYVQKLQLEYHFPAYTGLPPQKVEEGGDIAVLRGTEVRVRAVPTMATSGGAVVIEKIGDAALTPAKDGALTGAFKVNRDGFYHLEMNAPSGERVNASPQYTIDILEDQAPTVSISKPGRDTDASPIEELFVEAKADDDFGIRNLELVYSVNGGPEQKVQLFQGKSRLAEVSAGHTFYLEELSLKPGDSISYFARATDNDSVGGAKPATSDMYFVRIRPLSKDFKQAQSQAQGGGGGGGGGQQGQDPSNFSEQQRRIIAATFNVQRDAKKMPADKLREGTTVVALSQKKLRETVEEMVQQMGRRLGGDERFKQILALLSQAVPEMKTAEAKLQAQTPEAALPAEQKSLQLLQQAEELYETIVQQQQQGGGGGGGGGGQQQNRDLSDLFELEIDRTANQYEMRQQASQQQADQKVDEIAEKLKELAKRQEQEAERQRRRAAAGQTASGSGQGNSQRELAEQAEEAARRLEQLSREENRSDLAQSAQQLRQAADAMRRAAANGQQASSAQSTEALERLRQAEQQLQRSQTGRAERDVADAVRRAQELAQEQKDVAQQVQNLGAGPDRSREQVQQLLDRKADMEKQVGELEKQIDRAAADMRRDERDASRKMNEAAASLRDNRVRDKIRYSGAMVRSGMSTTDTANFEREIGSNLDSLRNRLEEAQGALGRTRPDSQAEALNRARQLARSMESMNERARERQQQSAEQGQGAREQGQGREGQQGQGREGQQGQGREGQQGQQGRGREGQQGQGREGQQGQGQGQGREGQQGQQGQGQGQGREGQQGQQGQQGQGQGREGQAREGQQGGQGGRNQGGRTQDGRGGEGDTTGAPNYAGGYGDRRPGGAMTPQDARQFRNELRQLTNDARALRGSLEGNRTDQQSLDEIMKQLRALDSDAVFKDPAQFDRLQSAAAEAVKRFEFNLRRRAELKGNEVLLSGDGDIPEEFRKLVEQYYKSLSKAPDKKTKAPEKK